MIRNRSRGGWGRFLSSKENSRKPCRPIRSRPSLEILEDRLVLSTFMVTDTGDNGGVNPAVGAGTGTLRQAIVDANAASGFSFIDFDISGSGVQTISLLSALPAITTAVTIDGTSQPGFAGAPLIVLDGAKAGSGAIGLTISAGNSTVKDLVIDNFSSETGYGIELLTNGGDVVTGNYIGTDSTGTAKAGNAFGIVIQSSSNNTIGGTTAAARNIISGNSNEGVNISGSATSNVVEGNYIGTDVTGTAALGNVADGVTIVGGATDNTVGGTVAGAGNIISANTYGVDIADSGTSGNVVQGNFIGTNANGTAALSTVQYAGVTIEGGATDNTVGGTVAGAGNVISANSYGVEFYDNGTSGNVVQGNLIGTNANDTTALGNEYGVECHSVKRSLFHRLRFGQSCQGGGLLQ